MPSEVHDADAFGVVPQFAQDELRVFFARLIHVRDDDDIRALEVLGQLLAPLARAALVRRGA